MTGADPPDDPVPNASPLPGVHPQVSQTLYNDLRAIARRFLLRERPNHTLRPTELANEVYLRIHGAQVPIQDRAHFLALAARIMRRYLVDYARRRASEKHGGGLVRVPIEDVVEGIEAHSIEILDLDIALVALEREDPVAGRIVECKFYGGMTDVEIAGVMGRSDRWVRLKWESARAWLRARLADGADEASGPTA